MPPLATFLIATLGWRQASFVLGAVAAVVGAGMALLIENDPHHRGLGPDGDPVQSPATSARPPERRSARPSGAERFRSLSLAC